ncbi:hypothetical protein BH11MYX4_BH11MYX4_54700 [soil metagenome]
MMRKQRGRVGTSSDTAAVGQGPCAVCGMSDARALVGVDLGGGQKVSLCGSHDLMHRRAGSPAASAADLRALFGNRRGIERRGGKGEVDELAEALSAAFCRDRRSSARRAS